MNLLRIISFLTTLLVLINTGLLSAQSLQHPVIWGTADDRDRVLELIDNQTWAQSLVKQLHERIDGKLAAHQNNPEDILNTVPEFAADDTYSEAKASPFSKGHHAVLATASEAGILYFLTQEEKYAQFSADIFAYYMDELAPRTPEKTTICGNAFYDPRTTYGHFAITYDFIYNYIKQADAKVYNKATGAMVPFDNTKAQMAIKNVVANVLQEYGAADKHGKTISNHPILTASGALFPILCVEDDTERERLFKVFWETGTKHQNSFKHTILPMFGEQGIWPEALSYSFMPAITMVLNIVDRIKPEMNVIENNTHVLDGNFLFDNLRNPDRRFVRYGDSKRNNDGTGDLYRFTLNLAERKGYTELAHKAKVALKQAYDTQGGYKPKLSSSQFNNYNSFHHLFWGVPVPATIEGEIDFQKPTVLVKHAGIALQRNYVKENNELYGLCGIIGGAHYVHSHATGIAMELYGAEYVMGPNGGLAKTLADRKAPEHTGYFWRHAGNNTMIVNGTTHGIQPNSWNSNSYLWQNTTINIAAEPKHLEDPISEKFSFATQFLADKVNNCDQERTLSTIRTSPTTAYYFDMFRSKSLDENNFHDYIYHNIGDETSIMNQNGGEINVTSTDRYQSDIGDFQKSPGWRFFEETKVTAPTSADVKVQFHIKHDNRYMHLFVPGGIKREYTKAVGPATREARNGYVSKKTQIIAIRQQGEAWNNPYVAIFEPSTNSESSVNSVANIYHNQKIVGAKVVSKINGSQITDIILCNDSDDANYILDEYKISFKGRFGIVRAEVKDNKTNVSLYIGDGQQLIFDGKEITARSDDKAVLEYSLDYAYEFATITGMEEYPKFTNPVLYPNPSHSGVFSISKVSNFKVYNIHGELILQDIGTHIDLSKHPKGVYLMREGRKALKLIR